MPSDAVIEHLAMHGVDIVAGPIARFGARGTGVSVYCRDPSGNEIEIISYPTA
jgi:extradiol dioxygenase family protein